MPYDVVAPSSNQWQAACEHSLLPRPNQRVKVWANDLPFRVAEHCIPAKVLVREKHVN